MPNTTSINPTRPVTPVKETPAPRSNRERQKRKETPGTTEQRPKGDADDQLPSHVDEYV